VQAFTRSVMAGATQTQAQAAKAPAAQAGGGGGELGLIPWPKVDFTKFGPVERKELSRIKKISGANLHRNAS
jgi:pyruvate dehydrogenase E2 component (dihydrolipoamide acetyltransferase)